MSNQRCSHDKSAYITLNQALDKKLLLIISTVGIIGAAISLVYLIFVQSAMIAILVQIISILVFGIIFILFKMKGWVILLSRVVVFFNTSLFIGMWIANTLSNHVVRILLIYVVIIILVLLKGRLRTILLTLLFFVVMFMLYYDIMLIDTQAKIDEYIELVLDSLIFGGMIILVVTLYKKHLEKTQRRLFEHSVKDPLTGAYNIRYFTHQLREYEKRWESHGTNYTTAIVDVDDFKTINDKHGHQKGDHVLKWLASHIVQGIGDQNIVSRYGGDEFVVIVGERDADKVKEFLEGLTIGSGNVEANLEGIHISVSVGLCSRREATVYGEDMLKLADKRMYEAKENRKIAAFGKARRCDG